LFCVVFDANCSVEGGTLITIKGSAFMGTAMNYHTGAEDASSFPARVYIGSNECTVIPFYSNDNIIKCIVPASTIGAGYATIRIIVMNMIVSTCKTTCTFRYLDGTCVSAIN